MCSVCLLIFGGNILPSQTCPQSFVEYLVHPVLPLQLTMGTVEVLGMPLLTSAVDQQIEETAKMEKKSLL